MLDRQSSERGKAEVTYFYVGDVFCIHLGTKYANFQEKIFVEISGKKFQTLGITYRVTKQNVNVQIRARTLGQSSLTLEIRQPKSPEFCQLSESVLRVKIGPLMNATVLFDSDSADFGK